MKVTFIRFKTAHAPLQAMPGTLSPAQAPHDKAIFEDLQNAEVPDRSLERRDTHSKSLKHS
jgi:hypothetical protein